MRRIIILAACLIAVGSAAAAQIMPTIVQFDRGQDRLTPRARTALQTFARTYARDGAGTSIVIAGHTSRAGEAAANVRLSQQRTAVARDYLVSMGIPSTVITTQAFGESRPLIETADGVREPRNDRIEITVGPGSGW